jgi:hypothetical protein
MHALSNDDPIKKILYGSNLLGSTLITSYVDAVWLVHILYKYAENHSFSLDVLL